MASHLTITSTVSGTAASRSFGLPQVASEGADMLGIFAALLGGTAASVPTSPLNRTGATTVDLDLGGVASLELDAGTAGEQDEADPDAVATAMGAVPVPLVAVEPAPVVELVEAVGALKASLDAGDPLDPELLETIDQALTKLADTLGLDLEALPVPEDFAALLEKAGDKGGLTGVVTRLLAPLAGSLAQAQMGTDAPAIADDVAAATKLEPLGKKLAALLKALDGDAVPAEKLAALGLAPTEPMAPEIEEALARLAAGVTSGAEVPQEPELAAPALKLTEPVLAGTSDRQAPEKPADTNGATRPDPVDKAEPRERRPETAPASANAAPVATSDTVPAETQPGTNQPASARIEAAATTRIVQQPGYQTSQQQLNLPQIAFELARQVQDGNTRFQIRLDPPELGRIDVRLEIDSAGQVNARLTVEKSETLDLMQRDQRGLERALQQAGIDANKTNLEFSLKQNGFAGQDSAMAGGREGRANGQQTGSDPTPDEAAAEPAPTVNLYRGALQASGVNIIA